MFLMRYQSLLFLSLIINIVISPLALKADTIDIIKQTNDAALKQHQNSQNRRSAQEDIKLITTAYKAMDRSSSAASNQKVHNEIIKIQITGRTAKVRVRTTVIGQVSSSTAIGEDTWQRNNNEWKIVTSRVLSINTTNRPQVNSTGQAQYYGDEAVSMIQEAVNKCYDEKDFTECRKLNKIQSTLVQECGQNNQQSCLLLNFTNSAIAIAMANNLVR